MLDKDGIWCNLHRAAASWPMMIIDQILVWMLKMSACKGKKTKGVTQKTKQVVLYSPQSSLRNKTKMNAEMK